MVELLQCTSPLDNAVLCSSPEHLWWVWSYVAKINLAQVIISGLLCHKAVEKAWNVCD